MKHLRCLSSALVLVSLRSITASTITVDLNGSGDFTTIQPAIDAAQPGDTVLVKAGEYVITEPISFKGKAMTVKSEAGAEATTIRMAEAPADPKRASVVVFESAETVAASLDGFRLTNGKGSLTGPNQVRAGGGVLFTGGSSPTLINCSISGSSAEDGGGVACWNASPMLVNCTISGNSAHSGGGVFCWNASSPTLTNCTILENRAIYGGGLYFANSSPTLTNCTISGNSADRWSGGGVYCSNSFPALTNCAISGNSAHFGGGGLYCDASSLTLTNCTISGNSSILYGGGVSCRNASSPALANCTISGNSNGGMYCSNSSPTLTNCIVRDNAGESVETNDGSSPIVSYSCIESAEVWPGTGNIHADPQFCGWDAAHVWVDASRPGPGSGTQVDPYSSLSRALGNYGLSLRQSSPCRGTGKDSADMGAALGICGTDGSASRVVHLAPGTYPTIAGFSLAHKVSLDGAGQQATVIEGTVYGLQTGGVLSGVKVTGGGSGGVLVSGNAPEIRDCTISGSSGSGVDCRNSSPTLTNCTISGNSGHNFRGFLNGGGVYCVGSSPTLTNCTISGNSADSGGGVYCVGSSSTLTNCTISGNMAGAGGGVACLGPALMTLTNCVLSGNQAYQGGGVYCQDASPTLSNCSISGNSSEGGGGLYCNSSSPRLTNCIVWENNGETIMLEGDSNPIVSFSCLDAGWPGDFNIDQDPSFVQPGHFEDSDGDDNVDTWIPGDYHLQPGSPCIDTGTCEGAPPLDIEGNPRPSGAGCDMGAYEFGSSLPRPRFHRGDPNSSGTTDISDGITVFGFLFLGNPATLSCNESADANNDGKIDISDGIYLLQWLFTGGPKPVTPGPTTMPCGVDPDPPGSAGDLGCGSYDHCN